MQLITHSHVKTTARRNISLVLLWAGGGAVLLQLLFAGTQILFGSTELS